MSSTPRPGRDAQTTLRARLAAELFLLYVAAPGLLALVSKAHRWVVLASIVGGSLLSIALLLRDRTFDRSAIWGGEAFRAGALRMLVRTVLVLLLLLAGLAVAGRFPEFRVPREQPAVWLCVLALYPLVSAVPQEVMYRSLFFHRYGALFPSDRSRLAASALLFGWAHVLVHNGLAVAMATAAGLLLSLTWLRSRSLLLVGFEHTLYGAFVFSAGVGGMFVNGVRLVSAALR
jgi:uncharacterized protein